MTFSVIIMVVCAFVTLASSILATAATLRANRIVRDVQGQRAALEGMQKLVQVQASAIKNGYSTLRFWVANEMSVLVAMQLKEDPAVRQLFRKLNMNEGKFYEHLESFIMTLQRALAHEINHLDEELRRATAGEMLNQMHQDVKAS